MSVDPTVAFRSTIDHALRLHEKREMLDQQVRMSLEVAGSIASSQSVDPSVIEAAILELRDAEVSGRGAVSSVLKMTTKAMRSRAFYLPGGTHTIVRHPPSIEGYFWPVPGIAVVYVLFNISATAFYVGRSMSIKNRMDGHRSKPWASVLLHICEDKPHSIRVEANTIRRYKPTLNKVGVW